MTAAFLVGLFYACAGYNKLFDPRRRQEMVMSMAKTMGLMGREARDMAFFVSSTQHLVGLASIAGALSSQKTLVLASNIVLAMVSASAYYLDGHRRMVWTWRPGNFADWVSCMLYTPEILLLAMGLVAITQSV